MRIPAVVVAELLAAALAGCAAPRSPVARTAPETGLVRVRLMHREHAVPGAGVTAVRNPGVALLEERVVAAAAADGRAQLGLAPGNWYLSAAAAEPPVFGWYGSNPVQIRAGETIEVTIPAVPTSAAGPSAASATTAVTVTRPLFCLVTSHHWVFTLLLILWIQHLVS